MRAEAGCLDWRLLAARLRHDRGRDADLVTRTRRGDPSAFEEIVRRHQKQVYNLAYRMLRRHEDAEDVTQEAFLKAFQSLPRLREEAAVGAWVCRIAANLCVSWLRSRRHATEVPLDPASVRERTQEGGARAGMRVHIIRAVADLPPIYRVAVVAHYLEGRSYEEAARVAGVGVRTLKTRLYRARKLLRKSLCGAVFCDEEPTR